MHSYLLRTRLPLIASAFALLALGLAPSAAQAQVTLYTSASAFRAASFASAPFCFDGYASPGGVYYYGHTFNFDTVDFSSSSLKVVSPNSEYGDPFGGHQFLSGLSDDPMYLSLPWGATAFGADFATLDGGPLDFTVNSTQVFHINSGTTFAGFVSDDPITTLSVSGGASRLGVNGMMLGDAVPAPEASSALSLGLLLLFGLLCYSVCSARRRHAD